MSTVCSVSERRLLLRDELGQRALAMPPVRAADRHARRARPRQARSALLAFLRRVRATPTLMQTACGGSVGGCALWCSNYKTVILAPLATKMLPFVSEPWPLVPASSCRSKLCIVAVSLLAQIAKNRVGRGVHNERGSGKSSSPPKAKRQTVQLTRCHANTWRVYERLRGAEKQSWVRIALAGQKIRRFVVAAALFASADRPLPRRAAAALSGQQPKSTCRRWLC